MVRLRSLRYNNKDNNNIQIVILKYTFHDHISEIDYD